MTTSRAFTLSLLPLMMACSSSVTTTNPRAAKPVENRTTPVHSTVPISADLRAALALDRAGTPTALDPKATARFAVLVTRYEQRGFVHTIDIHRVANGKVERESSARLPSGDAIVSSWGWRDATELVVLQSDGNLLAIRGAKVERIERPAKRYFTTKNPGGGVERFDRDDGLIFTAADEAWLQHCGWGYLGDNNPCVANVFVRVAPSPVEVDTNAPSARSRSAQLGKPAGWTYSITAGPQLPYGTLHCKGPDAAATHAPPTDSFGYSIDDAKWLSHRPPIASVVAWYPGFDDAAGTERFLTGCTIAQTFQPRSIVVGPKGFWAIDDSPPTMGGTDKAITVVFWHGLPIASLEGADSIEFAP